MDFKERAVTLALETPRVFRSKHAALLCYKGRVLSIGVNRYKTHPMMKRFSRHPDAVNLHAEIDCIVKAINRYGTEILKSSQLYVARVLDNGTLRSSCPCSGCRKAIEAFEISKVYYTVEGGWNV